MFQLLVGVSSAVSAVATLVAVCAIASLDAVCATSSCMLFVQLQVGLQLMQV